MWPTLWHALLIVVLGADGVAFIKSASSAATAEDSTAITAEELEAKVKEWKNIKVTALSPHIFQIKNMLSNDDIKDLMQLVGKGLKGVEGETMLYYQSSITFYLRKKCNFVSYVPHCPLPNSNLADNNPQ